MSIFRLFCVCICCMWISACQQPSASAPTAPTSTLAAPPRTVTHLPPADERVLREDFQAFYEAWSAAVLARDTAWIRAHLAPKIQQVRGEAHLPRANFLEVWQWPEKEDWWILAARMLQRGGAFIREDYTAYQTPYWVADTPLELIPSDYYIALGKGISMRAQPNVHAKLLTRLTYALLRKRTQKDEEQVREQIGGKVDIWRAVEVVETHEKGYVFGGLLRPLDDYSFIFEYQEQDWYLVACWKPSAASWQDLLHCSE